MNVVLSLVVMHQIIINTNLDLFRLLYKKKKLVIAWCACSVILLLSEG